MNNTSNPRLSRPALTRRELLRWFSAFSASAGLLGCGGGGSGGESAGGGTAGDDPAEPKTAFSKPGKGVPGAPVSPAQRALALDALNAKLDELFDATRGIASPARTIAWLEQQDAYQTVGYSATRNVYAVFTDGRPLIVGSNVRTDAAGVSDGPPAAARADTAALRARTMAAARPAAAVAAALPSEFEAGIPSRQFRYLNTWRFGTDASGFGTPARPSVWCRPGLSGLDDLINVRPYMEEFGYQTIELGNSSQGEAVVATALTVEGLKNVTGDGVFFWSTHGGTLDPGGNIIQGLMTGTIAYQSTVEDTYADEFAEGTLIYYSGELCFDRSRCVSGTGGSQTRLAITPKFIKKYQWKFGEHSLVFVNACVSATGEMKQAFLDAGASVYLGWTKPVRLWAMCGAASDVFSLMLGLNNNLGNEGDLKYSKPLQRPYDWGAVMDHLHANTQAAYYLDAEDGIVELEPTLNTAVPVGFLGLRPSIYWTAFDEIKSELRLIGGVFGTHPGSAAIGPDMPFPCATFEECTSFTSLADRRLTAPVALVVKEWLSDNLVLEVPASGAGSTGIVQVEVDGRWSNGIQLTRVNFPLTASTNYGGSLSVIVNAELSFRGDFRGVRLSPVLDLTYLPLVVCTTPPTASGTFIAKGSYSYRDGDSSVTVEWSGTGAVGPIAPGISELGFGGKVVPQSRAGAFTLSVAGRGIEEKVTVTSPGQEPRVTVRTVGFEMGSQNRNEGELSIVVPFSTAYGADTVSQSYTVPRAGPYNEAAVTTAIACGPFTAEFPPEDRKGGR